MCLSESCTINNDLSKNDGHNDAWIVKSNWKSSSGHCVYSRCGYGDLYGLKMPQKWRLKNVAEFTTSRKFDFHHFCITVTPDILYLEMGVLLSAPKLGYGHYWST